MPNQSERIRDILVSDAVTAARSIIDREAVLAAEVKTKIADSGANSIQTPDAGVTAHLDGAAQPEVGGMMSKGLEPPMPGNPN